MVDVDSDYTGLVIDKLTGSRKGVLVEMKDALEGKVRLSQSDWLSIIVFPLSCPILPYHSGKPVHCWGNVTPPRDSYHDYSTVFIENFKYDKGLYIITTNLKAKQHHNNTNHHTTFSVLPKKKNHYKNGIQGLSTFNFKVNMVNEMHWKSHYTRQVAKQPDNFICSL